ncbi:MAG: vanadium-dependent haloperoxidase [Acidobacteria bacterium]|nr:vanadium-dependent haloperoxidase [Acidobacteriota bacterium]
MFTAIHRNTMSPARRRRTVVTAALGLCVFTAPALARADDPVLEWNDIARRLIVVPALAPVQQTRAMAIVHVAVHDAVNSITREYEPYLSIGSAPAGVSPEAAAIAAAYQSLRGLFGDSDFLSTAYATSLAAHGISPVDSGLGFGQSVAEGILALRQQDGAALAAFPYLPPDVGLVGVWAPISSAPSAQALLPGWGNVTPWVLRSGSQFRPDPPPALDSERYATDYNEVVQLGAAVNSMRTDEQTQIALFWRASPTAVWNPILRKAVQSRGLDLSATARVMGLFYLAAADASVACWEAKYVYNYWRPQPAIANGDADGNDATAADPAWRPLVPTPPHPEYPSAHTANSGAMAHVLKSIFGDAPGFAIEATSSQNVGFVRLWQTFGEGVEEVIDARVYSGIHFRTADEVGARLGRQVAKFVLKHALRPEKKRGKR